MKFSVSVVIPSYNSKRTIRWCLTSLQKQTYEEAFEIILVDSSDDGTDALVRHEFPQVQLIHLPQKTDPGTGRRLGVEQARGSLILFIDADCIAPENWVEKHVQQHTNLPNVAAVGGAVVNGNDPKIRTSWAGYLAEFREFIPQQPSGFVKHLPTLNLSYKRWVFEKYGYFDSRYYPQEDLVFNFLLTQNGEKIFFDPTIVVQHCHNPSFKAFLQHQKRIGRITAVVLKILPLNGAFIARNKVLFFLAAPLLPLIKFFRTLIIFFQKAPTILLKHPSSIILFAIGLIYWLIGFAQGVLDEQEHNK